MKNMRERTGGRLKNNFVLPQDKPVKCDSTENSNITRPLSGINIELLISMDLNHLISGIDGFVWATKNIQQAEIISNAIRVQNIELEIVKAEFKDTFLYLLKVANKQDVQTAIDFIQNDISGLRLKPDWTYPEGERNESFDQWTKG